jgi:hypothetical protein
LTAEAENEKAIDMDGRKAQLTIARKRSEWKNDYD